MSRFAFHRQGQSARDCTRSYALACRGLALVLPPSAGPGHHPTGVDVSPSTDSQKGPLPTVGDRVTTLGEI